LTVSPVRARASRGARSRAGSTPRPVGEIAQHESHRPSAEVHRRGSRSGIRARRRPSRTGWLPSCRTRSSPPGRHRRRPGRSACRSRGVKRLAAHLARVAAGTLISDCVASFPPCRNASPSLDSPRSARAAAFDSVRAGRLLGTGIGLWSALSDHELEQVETDKVAGGPAPTSRHRCSPDDREQPPFVCERPRRSGAALGDLGLAASELERHIAYDIGIPAGRRAARGVRRPVAADLLRFAIDCNWAPMSPSRSRRPASDRDPGQQVLSPSSAGADRGVVPALS
jgi:hypothetical protein